MIKAGVSLILDPGLYPTRHFRAIISTGGIIIGRGGTIIVTGGIITRHGGTIIGTGGTSRSILFALPTSMLSIIFVVCSRRQG